MGWRHLPAFVSTAGFLVLAVGMGTTVWAAADFHEYGEAVHAKNEILYVTRGLWSVCYSAFGLTECEHLDAGNIAPQDHAVRFFVMIGALLAAAGLGLEAYYIRRDHMGEAVPVIVKYASGVLILAAAVCTLVGTLVYTATGPKGWNINDHIQFPGTVFDGSKWQFGYSVYLAWASVVPLLAAGCALLHQARTLNKDVSNDFGANKIENFHTHHEIHNIE
ncbi:claudin-11-like [Branchiostoma lanceolatum]|uniref:Claudin n=1 Tax=Branchiostoma lanceolatum TaxID=7740 RepID=A0A8K0EKU9_BRALA|nr:Hypp9305 [Branchiostoma lanceolatum]